MSKFLTGPSRSATHPSVELEPLEADASEPEVQPYREFVPSWGRRGTLWEWLVVVAVAAIFVVLFAQTTFDRAEKLGSAAFPEWYWRVYDWKVWPLKYFR